MGGRRSAVLNGQARKSWLSFFPSVGNLHIEVLPLRPRVNEWSLAILPGEDGAGLERFRSQNTCEIRVFRSAVSNVPDLKAGSRQLLYGSNRSAGVRGRELIVPLHNPADVLHELEFTARVL